MLTFSLGSLGLADVDGGTGAATGRGGTGAVNNVQLGCVFSSGDANEDRDMLKSKLLRVDVVEVCSLGGNGMVETGVDVLSAKEVQQEPEPLLLPADV